MGKGHGLTRDLNTFWETVNRGRTGEAPRVSCSTRTNSLPAHRNHKEAGWRGPPRELNPQSSAGRGGADREGQRHPGLCHRTPVTILFPDGQSRTEDSKCVALAQSGGGRAQLGAKTAGHRPTLPPPKPPSHSPPHATGPSALTRWHQSIEQHDVLCFYGRWVR